MGWLSAAVGGAFDLASGLLGSKSTSDANEDNIKLQKEFAKNAVQWKTADALKAGIHPLYALGAPTMSFSPSSVGDSSLPNALSNMGQEVSRAIDAGGTVEDRAIRKLTLERGGLENEKLKTEIALARSQLGPGSPVGANTLIPGQGNAVSIIPGRKSSLPPGVADAQVAENKFGEMTDIPYGIHFAVNTLFGPGGPFSEGNTMPDLKAIQSWWRNRVAKGRARMQSWR